MRVASNGAFGVVFVIGLAAAGVAWAGPATDPYNDGNRLLKLDKAIDLDPRNARPYGGRG